ncbi:MFS transporter [Novosphingobium sp. PP1Y]|uniref:MFS transporter n=1 Tax=Novosphingobium sp. PP1Y TaxID=702113 RepID=UPI00020EF9F7|nr:MFS transporter [Novosphingobium sp. PP1Y]CCA90685.1 major facilitator transporter [Novosphingobium sp. PP1Y]
MTKSVEEKPGYEFKAIALLALGFGLVGLDRWLIMPLSPQIMRDLDLDYQDIGNLAAILGLSWGLFAIVMGRLSDRIGRRKILIPAIVAFSLLSGASGLATGLGMLLLARLMMGVAEGAYCPASYAASIDASPPQRRGLNLGIIQGSFALFGLALGPIIATQLVELVSSWRIVFGLVAIPGLIIAALMYVVLREPARPVVSDEQPKPHVPWLDLFRYHNIRIAMPAIFCAMSGLFVIGSLTPVFLTDVIGLSGTQMGFVMSGLGFGGFLGQIAVCGASDVLGRRVTAITAFVLAAASLATLTLYAQTPGALFMLLFSSAFFCCGAIALLAGPLSGEAVPPAIASSAMGLVIGAGEIFGGGVAPSVAGFIAQHAGLPTAFLTIAAVLTCGGILSLFFQETAPRALARRAVGSPATAEVGAQ